MLCVGVLRLTKGRGTTPLSPRRLLAEIVDGINQMSSHLLEVARLHEEVFGGRFDVEARLVALERAEKERQQREWEEGASSVASASAPNSPFKSVSVCPPCRSAFFPSFFLGSPPVISRS